MKIVISHDIDHLSVREHIFKDLIIPKYIFWSIVELARRKINFGTFLIKLGMLGKKNGWNNLDELLKFDKQHGVNPTFFVGVRNGKGLSYSLAQAQRAIKAIRDYGFDVGLHGIAFNNFERMKQESEIFRALSGLKEFGVRMHYLRLAPQTLNMLDQLGYIFDSSILSSGSIAQGYRINRMVEFPFHIMDGAILGPKVSYGLCEAKAITERLLNKAEAEKKDYVGILFHQRYFGPDFPHYRAWYIWLINHCKERGYKFANYRQLMDKG